LLAFARGQTLAPERHDINDLLGRSMEIYRRACGPTIEFQETLNERLAAVEVDTGQFEAAILNLVTNSRDAMPKGGTIALGTRLVHRAPPEAPEAPSRDYVCISISDNGEGMSADVSARATEPFYTTKEIGKGSGLGLSQVFGFAAQSGGFAILDSEVGAGTVVSLCLPALAR
jgi:signal transduction histidine kinase